MSSIVRPQLRTTWLVWLLSAAFSVMLALCAAPASALDVPPLTGRVVDGANVLPPDAEQRITALLEAHERGSGQQFAVLTVPSLDGDPIENFSIRVVEAWKLGKKGKDDGLLLLVVPKDRKVRVEVGYGLEGDVTDAVSARVIREVMQPAFRQSDYAGGIERALATLMQKSSGQVPNVPGAPAPAPMRQPERGPSFGVLMFLVLFLAPLLLPMLLGRRGRRGGGFFIFPGIGGGGFGGGGGGGFGGGGFGGGGGGFGGGGASGDW
ncbi:MAG TPA: TPM domain-containing protein [Polyangiaceae bacterium]